MPHAPRLFEEAFRGRRVFLTGHTGFTGSWAALWLESIGAEVMGYALAPNTEPSLYASLEPALKIDSRIADINDASSVRNVMQAFQPDFVLHLAAQPLVRLSYSEPVSTFETNVMGTIHVLEAIRNTPSVKAGICVTTDKVYMNREWEWPYRENDPLGGKDPYSASKSAAEMAIASYVASFRTVSGDPLPVAVARGGNIIGGGDWSADRLVPDYVRAIQQRRTLTLRYPDATRPWQHVLALVQGYLMLLAAVERDPPKFARAWNLGPQDPRSMSVREVVDSLAASWAAPTLELMDSALPEAQALALDSTLARNRLGWIPPWDTDRVVLETGRWYRAYYDDPSNAARLTLEQLRQWRSEMKWVFSTQTSLVDAASGTA